MKKIMISNTNYEFVHDFKDSTEIRRSFNALARATFDFDFEDYYKSGYWNERYIPYALLDEGRVVANVAANILDFSVLGELKRYIQIGTVMTDKSYRCRGLSRYLLETVINAWQDKSDMIYLFANDTVLDFYPKYDFYRKSEYQYAKAIPPNKADMTALRLDMDEPKNRELLFHLADNTCCLSKLVALHNTALVMFYATSFMKDSFYYIRELDAAVLAEYNGNTLYLNDIFSRRNTTIDDVISAMRKPATDKVILGFTPIDTNGYHCTPYVMDDTTLFVRLKGKSIFDENKLMLPIVSHA